MTDTKRIKDISTTITSPSDDDYLVSDGATNGTNKILAQKFEEVAHKETSALDTSTIKYPCNNVVKTAVDLKADASVVSSHISNTSNPHSVTALQVGLGNCDNTSDANKPISSATQTALNAKANDNAVVHLAGTETITGAKTFSSDITNNANEILTNTTFANQNGIIKKGTTPFLHNFNYGNNGTVTTNGSNTFLGINSGNFTTGATATISVHSSQNTGLGYGTLNLVTTGHSNTAIGHKALNGGTTIEENTAVGNGALMNNVSSSANTAIGATALVSITTGANNTALGNRSGRYIANGSTANSTSSTSLYLGAETKAGANGNTNETVVGYNTVGNGSNTATIGNASVTDIYAGQSGGATVNAGSITCSPTLSSGTVAPTSTPAKIGDMYINTVLKHTYVAKGTSSSADWIKQNGSYTIDCFTQNPLASPADATSYYWGFGPVYSIPTTDSTLLRIYIPRSGTITGAIILFNYVAGSSEKSTLFLRVNSTTDYTISSNIVNNANYYREQVTGLSIPVSAGDYIAMKWVTPTWATNPTSFSPYVKLLVDL